MAKVLVVYYSRTGNTEKMARQIADSVAAEGLEVECKSVLDTSVDDLLAAEGIIMGSPTYYGTMSAELKRLIDDSVEYHGRLEGKVGAAFTSSGVLGGGNETTVMHILGALLVHGMIVQGDPQGCHYGAVCIGTPEEEDLQRCQRLGQRFAQLVKKVCG